MIENQESISERFIFPNVAKEYGEFERVAALYNLNVDKIIQIATQGQMVELSEDLWSLLENTDSYDIELGDWEFVASCADQQEVPRDWKSLRDKLATATPVDAPIVMKCGDSLHLVSGNTRLMVARVAGIKPTILLFEV